MRIIREVLKTLSGSTVKKILYLSHFSSNLSFFVAVFRSRPCIRRTLNFSKKCNK